MCRKNIYPLFILLLSILVSHETYAQFIRGVDISMQTQQETEGVIYKEYGVPRDIFTILSNHDLDWIRLRLFHTPGGSVSGVCQDLDYVTELGARAKSEGFNFLLDIHYSDTWADPTHQTIPAAWQGMNHAQLVVAVYDYTRDVIEHLRTNNAMPDMVQIGNETPCGMLWPDGEVCNNGNWSNYADLVNAGIDGVDDGRGTEPMPEIMIHIDKGGNQATTEWFFDNLLARGVSFDVIGQSFYPEWHGTFTDLTNCLNFMGQNYSQDIIIAETAEYYTGETGASPENQKAFLEELIQRIEATPNGKGRGVFYWEPTWVWGSPCGYRALFEPAPAWDDVDMLMAMEAFDITGGDTTPPDAPMALAATAGDGTVSIDWDDNSEGDLDGYNIYRSTFSSSNYVQLNGALLSSSNYTDNSVTNGIIYYYIVTAVDTSNNESDPSGEESAAPSGEGPLYISADFESGFGDWVNVTGDTHDWMRNSGSTPSSSTGPSGGANGSTWYVYLETSSGYAYSAGDMAYLEGPALGGSDRVLTFYYHMYGSNIGTLNVDVYDGSWHNGIWSLSGQQHTSSSDPYTQAIVDLSAYTETIRIRFRAVAAGGSRGDMAIDDIEITGILSEELYGDFTGDHTVDIDDLPEFLGYWLASYCGELDLNGDCVINLHEFWEFAHNWLQ
ncbi:MAG: glycosyl hydrolase 53 family protein [Sedimentisphaerales bacterium]|nr:glycosyl hydrolase 53 family protein [Sedimentisphaerales bacterium]